MKLIYPFSGHQPPKGRPPIHLLVSIHLLLYQISQIKSATLTTTADSTAVPPSVTTRRYTKDSNRSNDRLLQEDDKSLSSGYASNGFEIDPHGIVAQQIDDPLTNTDRPVIEQQTASQRPFSAYRIRYRNCGVQQLSSARLTALPSLSERHSLAFSKLVRSKLEQYRNEGKHQQVTGVGGPLKGVHHPENKSSSNKNRFYNFELSSIAGSRRKSNSRRGKVVGGELAYDGEFPWTVSIRKFDAHHCGGVS